LNETNPENPKEKCQKLVFNLVQTWPETTQLNKPWPREPSPLCILWQPMPTGNGQSAHDTWSLALGAASAHGMLGSAVKCGVDGENRWDGEEMLHRQVPQQHRGKVDMRQLVDRATGSEEH
jgi:hypothetical protein